MGTARKLGANSMIQVSPGNFIPVSNFAGTSTSFAPRGGLGAQGAGFGSLTVGGLGAGSSGMTGGGGSYVSPGQATVPTEKEQYNIRKGAVKKALNNLSNAIADARAFDKGASGLTTEQKQQAVTDARKEVETLGITRDEIESFNKDQGREVISPRVVEGNLLDKAGDFTQDAGQELIDLIATGGQKFSDIITLGQGPEVAQTLLDPISILTGGLGGTINYGDSGKTTPVILGTQRGTGQQVGLNIPDPRSIFEGGLPGILGGLGGLGTMAGAASLTDADPSSGVGTSAASVLAAANAADDKTKTTTTTTPTTPTSDTGSVATKTDTTTSIKDTPSVVTDTIELIKDAPSVVTETGLIPIDDPFKGEKTSVVKTGEEVKTSTPAAGGVGGIGGMPAGGGGTRTISGGPGPLVDIDYLYDMAGSLAQPFLSTEDEDEEDLKVYAKGGGHVKKFSNGMNVGKSAQDYFDATAGKTGGKFNFRDFIDQNALGIAGALVGGLLGASDKGSSAPVGYQGGIPDYTFNRKLKDNAFSNVLDAQGNRINPLAATETSTMRRPGSMGRSYFDYGDELFTGTGTMQGVGLPSLVETDTTATTTTGLPPGFTYTPVDDVDTTEGAFGGAGAVDTGIGAVTPTPETETPDTPTPTPTAYELLEADGDYTPEEVSTVVEAIKSGEVGTGNVAEKFNVGETEIYANLLRQGAYTPAELANYIATEGNDPTYTEQDLIVRLLQDGLTTPEEVADYYKVEVDSVKENFKKLGGTRELAQGGPLNNYYLGGPTDGMADLIPASIDGTQPAALSDGEFVIPADVVSHLGNGNSDAGANQLMSMMDRVRNARTGTTKQGTEIDPMKMMPA